MNSARWQGAATLAFLFAAVVFFARGVAIRVLSTTPVRDDAGVARLAPTASVAEMYQGFLYGRITTVDGDTYEGRLRWGRDQEAFWGDYFNGVKDDNPWAVHAPRARQPKERTSFEIFGVEIGGDRSNDLIRPFMARFGDIARIEAHVRDVYVTLKSGTSFELDRFAAGDIDDGVRVWDRRRDVVDLDSSQLRTIEFLPTAPLPAVPARLHGTVRTRHGDFTGFIQWDWKDCVGSDTLDGRAADGEQRIRYDRIRSIARRARDRAQVTLLDGSQVVLADGREVGDGHSGIYVDDHRYGRVLISWGAFERIDFSAGGSGPAYGHLPPGRALAGSVTTRDGRRLTGRLVYDFDESETTETLDAALPGIDYFIPFSLVAAVVPEGREGQGGRHALLILRDGDELQLERTGDLGDRHAGMLIFVDGRDRPEHVRWTDVERIDFDRAPAR